MWYRGNGTEQYPSEIKHSDDWDVLEFEGCEEEGGRGSVLAICTWVFLNARSIQVMFYYQMLQYASRLYAIPLV